ncbi:MAG: hypothetical protein AB7R69_03025 [Candidatus Babeliales bacterium]
MKRIVVMLSLVFALNLGAAQVQKTNSEHYEKLKKALGYDPEVEAFDALRRLVFEHAKGKFGVEYLKNKKELLVYIHPKGDTDTSGVFVDFKNQHGIVFKFPDDQTTKKLNDKKVLELIQNYIEELYKPQKLSVFGDRERIEELLK